MAESGVSCESLVWVELEQRLHLIIVTIVNAIVTIVTDRFGPVVNRWILVITDIMMLAAASFIAWRLYDGMLDKFRYNETTLLLRMPLGWSYTAGLVGAVVFVIVAIYVLGRSISNALAGRSETLSSGAEL